jgi:hypothetical protein
MLELVEMGIDEAADLGARMIPRTSRASVKNTATM